MRELELHDTNGIIFLAVAEVNGEAYFSSWYHNGLFRLHKDGATEFIMLFDKNGDESPWHEFAVGAEDTVMFVPASMENEIALFTPQDMKMEYLKFPSSGKKCLGRPFWGYAKENNITYLLPNNYDAVLAFNEDSKRFLRYVLPVDKDIFSKGESVFANGVTVDKTVYFCPWNCSGVLTFNLQTMEFKTVARVAERTFRHIFHIDGRLYFIPRALGTDIVIYDIKENCLLEKAMPEAVRGACICMFHDGEGSIYLLPDRGDRVWIWNPASGALDSIALKIPGDIELGQVCFNEARALWNGRIIFTAQETLSAMLFDKKEFRAFDIGRGEGLFLDMLLSMVRHREGITVHEY